MNIIGEIIKASKHIYNSIEYSPNEHYYQSHLQLELQDMKYVVQSEVAISLHHTTLSGNKYPLPDGLNGRIDLLLPNEHIIIELKSIKKSCDKPEWTQLRKYMKEYYCKWGNNTKGLLINFGDNELEIIFMYYKNENEIICERLVKVSKLVPIHICDDYLNKNKY